MQFIRHNGETAGGPTSIIERRTLEYVFKHVADLLLHSVIETSICITNVETCFSDRIVLSFHYIII